MEGLSAVFRFISLHRRSECLLPLCLLFCRHITRIWPVSLHFIGEEAGHASLNTNILHNWHFPGRLSASVHVCAGMMARQGQADTKKYLTLMWHEIRARADKFSRVRPNLHLITHPARLACSQLRSSTWKLADFTAWMTGLLRLTVYVSFPTVAQWFALRSHAVTGRAVQQRQQRCTRYGASMLCFLGYATAAQGDAALTRRTLSVLLIHSLLFHFVCTPAWINPPHTLHL